MKKTLAGMGAAVLLLSASVKAQQTWDPKKNPTVDSITSKFKLAETPKPITIEQVFPVIGQYQLTNVADNTAAGSVKIMLDEANKGIIWVEGLPAGKIQAQLRRSPATYKIPAQKTEDGKDIPEGTLVYNKDTKVISICLGKAYNMENPELAFSAEQPAEVAKPESVKTAKTQIKTDKKPIVIKPVIYSGTKTEQTTVMNN
jgi:hypothetical protein